jgi:hypothetical protein
LSNNFHFPFPCSEVAAQGLTYQTDEKREKYEEHHPQNKRYLPKLKAGYRNNLNHASLLSLLLDVRLIPPHPLIKSEQYSRTKDRLKPFRRRLTDMKLLI